MYKNIRLECEASIAILTVNRPEKRNAINNATVDEIDSALEFIENQAELRVLILTGAGEKAFVAGADIGELEKRDAISGRADTRRRQEVYTRIEQLAIPSIAAINGWALGTGLELALACNIRIAADNARMGQPEVKLGIIPGAGGTFRLPRLVGLGRAMEIILTGNPVTAEEAHQMGLVNRVVPQGDLMTETLSLVRTIAALPKLAVQYAKEAVLRANEGSLNEGLAHESYLHALVCGTNDKKEGVAAFLEKREAKFSGS